MAPASYIVEESSRLVSIKVGLERVLERSYFDSIARGQRNVSLVNICVIADALGPIQVKF